MLSFVLHDRIFFLVCILINLPFLFAMCLVLLSFFLKLKPGLNKLIPTVVSCVFVGYSQTQKEYRGFDHVYYKFYTFTDITFFESLLYFTHVSPIPHPMPNFGYLEKEIVPKSL